MSKVKNLPLTLDEVLSCTETVMMQEAKVALIAMVKRQRRAGVSMALPVGRKELCAKLGMDPAVGLEAIRQLVRLDYLHREGDNVQMVLGHPIIKTLEVGRLNNTPAEDLAAEVEKLLAPPPSSPERAARVARAVGKDDPPEPEPAQSTSVPVPRPQPTPAAEGNPDGGSVEPPAPPDQDAIDKALKALVAKKKAKKRSPKRITKKS